MSSGSPRTKYGCGIAQCGACTVHVNGVAMRSCSMPIASLDGATITTIEGLSPNGQPPRPARLDRGGRAAMRLLPVRADHGDCGVPQTHPAPTDAQIDANITNICRCGTYERLRRAIHRAANR